MRALACEPQDFAWFAERTNLGLCSDVRGIKAVDSAGRIQGMVLFDRWTFSSAHAHVALDSPFAGRVLLRAAFQYVFEDCGRSILLGMVAKRNQRSLWLAHNLGFALRHVVKDGFAPGNDLVLLEMRREACRWLERKAA